MSHKQHKCILVCICVAQCKLNISICIKGCKNLQWLLHICRFNRSSIFFMTPWPPSIIWLINEWFIYIYNSLSFNKQFEHSLCILLSMDQAIFCVGSWFNILGLSITIIYFCLQYASNKRKVKFDSLFLDHLLLDLFAIYNALMTVSHFLYCHFNIKLLQLF